MLLPAPFDIFIERGIAYGPLVITVYDDLPPLTTPTAPTITDIGTAGATTRTYKIVARNTKTERFSAVSSGGTTATGNATLSTTNYQKIAWSSVTDANIYDVYRTVAGGTPNTTGLIGSIAGTFFYDTGLAGDGSTPPAIGGPGVIFNLTGFTPHAQARRIPDDTLLQNLNPTITNFAGGEITIPKFTDEQTLVFKPVLNGKWSLVLENSSGDWLSPIVAGAYTATFSVTRNQS